MAENIILMLLLPYIALAAPIPHLPDLLHISRSTGAGLLWASIGTAVATALLQGLVTALAFMTEESNHWTFRFRIARIEHWWWSLVSILLLSSLVLIILSFLAGNNNDAISILVLSSATTIAVVQYMLPSWRSRQYIDNRWHAWTGDSRTAVHYHEAQFCGSEENWKKIKKIARGKASISASDWYGWHVGTGRGLAEDPTALLNVVSEESTLFEHLRAPLIPENTGFPAQIYDDGYEYPAVKDVSLRWGASQNFRKRVSRAIRSVPTNLLKSNPFTTDGYAGQGLCLAMGILGRNKGLRPVTMVYHADMIENSYLERQSTWEPRPSKVLRSFYEQAMRMEYGGLGDMFVKAATELALILMDCPGPAIAVWLKHGLEQQNIMLNRDLRVLSNIQRHELNALYRASYVSMIISLNNMRNKNTGQKSENTIPLRPDLFCLGLLLKAEGKPEPQWWQQPGFLSRLQKESNALEKGWKTSAACLLGLADPVPEGFEEGVWERTAINERNEKWEVDAETLCKAQQDVEQACIVIDEEQV